MESKLRQRIADAIIKLRYCQKHWYYPSCAWWLFKRRYITPHTNNLIIHILNKLQNYGR